jgi:3-keto-disaccharide hydrolase
MLPCMSTALSLVAPLSAVLIGNLLVPGQAGPTAQAPAAAVEATTPKAVVHLFNGRDLAGWKPDVPARDADPNGPPSFIVRDGKLVSLGTPEGHLVSDSRYRDYRLELEYRFPGKAGNCGVLIHASKPRALYKMFPQSIEVQMMSGNAGDFWVIREDIKVKDMETRRPRAAGEKWGSAEGDARRILNLTDNSEKPLGQWNSLIVEARGRSITVWVNGDLVNDGFDATVDQGRIALQAEGAEVEFRKVDIGPLGPAGK